MGLIDAIKEKIWGAEAPTVLAVRVGRAQQPLEELLSRIERSNEDIRKLQTTMRAAREWYATESGKLNNVLAPLLEQRKKFGARLALIEDHSEHVKHIENSARSFSSGLEHFRKIDRSMRKIAVEQLLALDDAVVKPDVEVAFDETDFADCKRAADIGNVKAMDALGKYHQPALGKYRQLNGDFEDSDLEAFNWYLKEGFANFAPALEEIASWYESGGGDADHQTAIRLYLKAARLGSRDAMCQAALTALDIDTEESRKSAFEWFSRAADAGDVVGMHMVGQCFANGWGVAPDEAKAFDWHLKAAALIDESAIGAFDRPFYYLGLCHQAGLGVCKNLAKAFEYFNLVATPGARYEYHAKLRLAHMYFAGNGVIVDKTKAFELFGEAASNGTDEEMLSDAMYMTGRCLYDGTGTAVDKRVAFDWFAKAAPLGNVRAMYMLGQCYFAALGTGYVDREEAFK